MSTNSPNQSKAQRRDAARAQALALKKKQEAADRRARLITMSVLGVVVVALLAVVVYLFVQDNKNKAAEAVDQIPLSEVQDVPSTARADGGIVIAADRSAGGTVDAGVPEVGIYFDYMCPICGQFEQINKEALEGFLTDGTANVVLFPVSILDRQSNGTAYSTRAASAAAWVADRAPASFLAFHEALFANEPEELTPGLTNEEIADIARDAGVPDDVAAGIASGQARQTFGQWVFSASRAASDDTALANPQTKGFGTPTITIDGVRWDGNWTDPTALPQAVKDATK
ncbi:disulfide bond formation protein DsbA [Xylanimonas allomyrinae]|uniref:Disulfide bond formation protein DsbA n=1 Tax=Xylanimonas allomyrinae TaxID=2509459 RepID=A0A4P6EQE6_9MICO|nr:thioredoxin domain-containing protein [Xylanimonas allomyrinae]QAY63639.1 disulfide bond formation protein DsbA [Xylanimonas allomyrinae]